MCRTRYWDTGTPLYQFICMVRRPIWKWYILCLKCVSLLWGRGGGKDLCHSSKLEAKMFWISYNLKIMIFRACISNYWLSSEYYIFPLIDHMCPLNLQFTYFEHTLQSYFQMHVLWVPFLDPNLTTHHSSIVECNMLQLLEVYFITTIIIY